MINIFARRLAELKSPSDHSRTESGAESQGRGCIQCGYIIIQEATGSFALILIRLVNGSRTRGSRNEEDKTKERAPAATPNLQGRLIHPIFQGPEGTQCKFSFEDV